MTRAGKLTATEVVAIVAIALNAAVISLTAILGAIAS